MASSSGDAFPLESAGVAMASSSGDALPLESAGEESGEEDFCENAEDLSYSQLDIFPDFLLDRAKTLR